MILNAQSRSLITQAFASVDVEFQPLNVSHNNTDSTRLVLQRLETLPTRCALPLGFASHVGVDFDLAGELPFAIEVRLPYTDYGIAQNLTAIGAFDLFVCPEGGTQWLRSSDFNCSESLPPFVPDANRSLLVSARICHNTPFSVMDIAFAANSTACDILPRVCHVCLDGYKGCACEFASSTDYVSNAGVITTVVVAALFFCVAQCLRVWAEERYNDSRRFRNQYTQALDSDEPAPPGGRAHGSSCTCGCDWFNEPLDDWRIWLSVGILAMSFGMVMGRLYMADSDWRTHNMNIEEYRTFVITNALLVVVAYRFILRSVCGLPPAQESCCHCCTNCNEFWAWVTPAAVVVAEAMSLTMVLYIAGEAAKDSVPSDGTGKTRAPVWLFFDTILMIVIVCDTGLTLTTRGRSHKPMSIVRWMVIGGRCFLWAFLSVLWTVVGVRYPCE